MSNFKKITGFIKKQDYNNEYKRACKKIRQNIHAFSDAEKYLLCENLGLNSSEEKICLLLSYLYAIGVGSFDSQKNIGSCFNLIQGNPSTAKRFDILCSDRGRDSIIQLIYENSSYFLSLNFKLDLNNLFEDLLYWPKDKGNKRAVKEWIKSYPNYIRHIGL